MRKKALTVLLSISIAMNLLCYSVSAYGLPCDTEAETLSADFWNTATIEVAEDAVVLTGTEVVKNVKSQAMRSAQQELQQQNKESCVKETVFFLPKEGYTTEDIYNELAEKYSLTAQASGNKTETGRDSSISVEGTLTIYYDRQTVNDTTYVKLTKVEGGYRLLDRQVRVNSQHLSVGCSGLVRGVGAKSQTDLLTCGTGTSWTYNAPSDWDFVCDGTDARYLVGANCIYTIQRVGSDNTWKLYLVNDL